MLYDKRWDKPEVKADPFSLESLIAWLEKQPANREYDYHKSGQCLIAQWIRSIDPEMSNGPGSSYHYIVFGKNRDFRPQFWQVAARGNDINGFTFGAALKRARAVQS